MGFSGYRRTTIFTISVVATVLLGSVCTVVPVRANAISVKSSNLGVIKGIVRDQGGSAIADATVAIFRVGTTQLLKQVRSASDGSFLARIMPGRYTVLAVAEGFNPVTVLQVDVGRSAELVYGFNLERAGSGNTLPEKRGDRNSSKWRIRAASAQRSIYQNTEGNSPVDEKTTAKDTTDSAYETAPDNRETNSRRPQGVVETYFASSDSGNYHGLNFATSLPINTINFVIAGQTGTGKAAPQRLQAVVGFHPKQNHQIRLNASAGRLGTITTAGRERSLGQFSLQALDEWTVREGVIVIAGLDYSRFLGAGNSLSISPRLGLQFDLDPKTRFRAAFTTQTEKKDWAHVIDLEDTQVAFEEPVAVDDLVVENGRPQLNKSRRFEFGIERVLDNNSSIEANAFFDLTPGRGVGLANLPFDAIGGEFSEFVGNQQGRAQGLRVVYNRRINGTFSTAAGYSFGNGQKLSGQPLTNPSNIFDSGFFQSFFGQVEADFSTGTNVRTVLRLSPQATVFAIDPFQGRLAIYDPSLSVLVTQNLPTLGLPFHAQAVVDARNIFDFQTGIATEDGVLRVNSQRRALRGGILVRF